MDKSLLDIWQYRLSATPTGSGVPVGRFWLNLGPGLGCFPVQDGTGQPVGVLVGNVIDLARKTVVDDVWRAAVTLTGDVDGFARQVLWSLGGNFIWIFAADGVERIYPDCSAQVPCVWDAVEGVAGSTAHALFDDAAYAKRFDKKEFDLLGVDGEGWFPAGQTAHTGIQRLLPCHFLNLSDWTAQRFWSVAEVETASAPGESIHKLVALVQAQMEALASTRKSIALGLTAGRETRTLLACARPLVDRIDTFTVVGTDRHMTDSVIARRIAKEFNIKHRELQRTTATAEQRERFIRRGGHCNADSNSWYHPSAWPIAETHVMVGGTGGEVGRGFFWRASDEAGTAITPQVLVNRLGLPATPSLLESVSVWRGGLPPMNAFQILDQAYLELRMGSWHGVQFCCNPTITRISPLLTYPCVEILLSLPHQWKRQSRFVDEIIRTNWPELLRIPFNSLGWLQDGLLNAQKIVNNPSIVWKRLRKMRG
jgi:hypothetical protein